MDFAHYWFGSNRANPIPFPINASLRFRGSQWLTRNLGSPSSTTTGTWSFWFKRARMNQNWKTFQCLMGCNDVWRFTYDSGSGSQFDDLMYSGSVTNGWSPKEAYRDPAGWVHHVLVFDTSNGNAADRLRLYLNGVRRTIRNGGNPGQNVNKQFGTQQLHVIGAQQNQSSNEAFDGYITEIHHVDGQALGPENFAEPNVDGAWVPIEPDIGAYGNNGFYLPLNGNDGFRESGGAWIARDLSGRGNDFDMVNFEMGNTTSTNYDRVNDGPSSNHSTLNTLCQTNPGRSSTAIKGQLQYNHDNEMESTIVVDTEAGGRYYCELTTVSNPGTGTVMLGVFNHEVTMWRDGAGRGDTNASWVYRSDAHRRHNGSTQNYGSNWFANGNVVSMLLDLDNRTLRYWTNGTDNGNAYTGLPDGRYTISVGSTGGTFNASLNGGSQPFRHTPPAGFVPLSSAEQPNVEVTNPRDFFNITTYNGSNSAQTITTGVRPDLLWIKCRNTARDDKICDSVRGTQRYFVARNSAAETTRTDLVQSFNDDGFTLFGNAADTNQAGNTYVAWSWTQAPGVFDIVEYTGNGGTQNVNHNLGAKPAAMWIKNRFNSPQFMIYNEGWTATYASFWSPGSNFDANSNYWNNTEPTATQFTLGSASNGNQNGNTYVAYLFANVPGFFAAGKAQGNGNTDGVYVYTGFRPAYVMWKNGSTTNNWFVLDSARDIANPCTQELYVDSQSQETQGAGSSGCMDFYADGFKLRSSYSDRNGNGNYFSYFAFAEHPFGGGNVAPSPGR